MLILKFVMIFLMSSALLCTLTARLHGTVVIGILASIYASSTNLPLFQSSIGLSLFLLILMAEVGGKGLHFFCTRHFPVTRLYGVDTMVCNLAGIIVADALFGSLVSIGIWEGVTEKNLLPRLGNISKVLLVVMLPAMLRFSCGVIMMIIIIKYIMYTN